MAKKTTKKEKEGVTQEDNASKVTKATKGKRGRPKGSRNKNNGNATDSKSKGNSKGSAKTNAKRNVSSKSKKVVGRGRPKKDNSVKKVKTAIKSKGSKIKVSAKSKSKVSKLDKSDFKLKSLNEYKGKDVKGRMTKAQRCDALRKERHSLYSRRKYYLNKTKRKDLSDAELKEAERRYDIINKRIADIGVDLFKCGKKFGLLETQKKKLSRHKSYLKGKMNNATTKRDKEKLWREYRQTIESINKLGNAMQLPVNVLTSQSVKMKYLGNAVFEGDDRIWELESMVERWIASGDFNIIVIDGEVIDLKENELVVRVKISMAINDVMTNQEFYKSGHFYYYGDPLNGYLEVWASNYTPDLYK